MGKKKNSNWDLKSCASEARKFKSRTEWAKGSSTSYSIAAQNGWLNHCCAHMAQKIKPNGFWTKEKCKAEARKFECRSDWAKKSGTSYNVALSKKWLDECCTHMHQKRKPMGYWTLERCEEEAKRHSCSTDWQKANAASYAIAIERGWYSQCSAHFKPRKLKNGSWTKEKCAKEAMKYKTRTALSKGSTGAYHAALEHGWLDDICSHMSTDRKHYGYSLNELQIEANKHQTKRAFRAANPKMVLWAQRHGIMNEICKHMRTIGNRKLRQLYAFEHPDRTAYVGHSADAHYRKEQHLNHKRTDKIGKILRQKRNEFGAGQIWKVFPGWYTETEAQIQEKELYEHYEKNGWTLLNSKSALGALGGTTTKWTLEKCLEVSLKCRKRSEIQKRFPSAYNAIRENGWKQQCYAHMGKGKTIKHSEEHLLSVIGKVKSLHELAEKYPQENRAIRKRPQFREWTKHLTRQRKRYTDQEILNISKKFKTRMEFFREAGDVYAAAKRRGIFELAVAHMKTRKRKK
jgi:hypothetical protein